MARFGIFPALLFLAGAVRAQTDGVDIPPVTPPNFSRLVGKYRISTSAAPTTVSAEEPITLKVRIVGAGPPDYHPERTHLRIFPDEMASAFYVEAIRGQDRAVPEKGLWEFAYRLRPKSERVARIPGLQLRYYDPVAKRFLSSFADEIPITVTSREEVTPDKLDLKVVLAPARFYQVRPVEPGDDSPMPSPGPPWLAALALLPPALCFLWYGIWRRFYPSDGEGRRRRRSRAGRLALAALTKHPDDVAAARAAAVLFLRQRLELPAAEATPPEVSRHLKRAGVARTLVADWGRFFQTCDSSLYAPAGSRADRRVAAEAIRLVHALEADPCLS